MNSFSDSKTVVFEFVVLVRFEMFFICTRISIYECLSHQGFMVSDFVLYEFHVQWNIYLVNF